MRFVHRPPATPAGCDALRLTYSAFVFLLEAARPAGRHAPAPFSPLPVPLRRTYVLFTMSSRGGFAVWYRPCVYTLDCTDVSTHARASQHTPDTGPAEPPKGGAGRLRSGQSKEAQRHGTSSALWMFGSFRAGRAPIVRARVEERGGLGAQVYREARLHTPSMSETRLARPIDRLWNKVR